MLTFYFYIIPFIYCLDSKVLLYYNWYTNYKWH